MGELLAQSRENKVSTIEGLQNILSALAGRDMIDGQVNDLRLNKENVGVAKALTDTHANASDAHQALFDLKANEADVYPRVVIDSLFAAHEGDEELHFTEEEKSNSLTWGNSYLVWL